MIKDDLERKPELWLNFGWIDCGTNSRVGMSNRRIATPDHSAEASYGMSATAQFLTMARGCSSVSLPPPLAVGLPVPDHTLCTAELSASPHLVLCVCPRPQSRPNLDELFTLLSSMRICLSFQFSKIGQSSVAHYWPDGRRSAR